MTARPRILLFAYSEVGAVCLDALLENGANVIAVYTHKDDPNEEIWFRSVQKIAEKNNIPVRTPEKLGDADIEEIKRFAPDLIFSFYYRAMIADNILNIPILGSYNIHGSLLPKYRGRACVNWAVLNGETETGATLHEMTKYADEGDIITQKTVTISFEDTAHDVFLKVADASRDILIASLKDLEIGNAKKTPQNEALATKFGRRTAKDGEIDWSKPAVEIYNLIRAVTHPFPGAFTTWENKKTFIWSAMPEKGEGEPGKILSTEPLLVGTGDGILRITSFQPEGEAERDA